MRFHAIQNVETALRFLRYKEIKLVNIRGEDIVDGNPKLTLGLIWTIILHFQVGPTGLPRVAVLYRVTELNVSRIWIELAVWAAMVSTAEFSFSGLRLIPSPGR